MPNWLKDEVEIVKSPVRDKQVKYPIVRLTYSYERGLDIPDSISRKDNFIG